MRKFSAALAVLLQAQLAMAGMPTFVANGATTVTAATGTCTPTMPGTIEPNDIIIVVGCGEGPDDGVNMLLTTANGFAAFGGQVSGSDGDAAEENPEINCRVWWKRAVGGGGDSAPVITDSGDHTTCAAHQFRGVKTDGNPHNTFQSNNDGNSNDQTASITGDTTTQPNVLVVMVATTSVNVTGTVNCSAVTNADLANIAEQFDSANTSGLGGGHCIITGEKATPGTYGDGTLTMSATTFKANFGIGLEGIRECGTTLTTTGAGCK